VEIGSRTIEYYFTVDGRAPFRDWYYSLKDLKARVTIRDRLTRLERGLFGDVRPVGGGVFELRIDFGPGYRLYFGLQKRIQIWLLFGGDKSTQRKDVRAAQIFWSDHLKRSES
jgi:putative addiction module killer protein